MARGHYSQEQLDEDALLVLLNTLGPHDTISIITCVSFLDEHLRFALQSVMRRKSETTKRLLNPSGGIAGGFSQKADLLYSLQIIEKKIYKDLKQICEVRNTVAHSHLRVGFDDVDVQKACGKLSLPDGDDLSEAAVTFMQGSGSSADEIARCRFRTSVVCIWDYLRQLATNKEKLDA